MPEQKCIPFVCAANGSACREEDSMNQKWTILYERLSRDDDLQGPSNSILNQRQLLEDYAGRNSLVPFVHIEDDGYTGTNWNRPGWQELIAKVEADEVACICIKDSSRLGRDYLRVGLFRELCHEKGVRLIAVNDNFDSSLGEDDLTPFREIMAEWYARDTSKKIKSVIAAKGKSGKPISNIPPYGFMPDPNDKHHWVIDPEAAAVVKRIFDMAMDGMGIFQIAGRLTREQIERPSYYLGVRGRGNRKSTYEQELPCDWRDCTIARILSRPEYCGHTVNFRTSSTNFKSKKRKNNTPEDWLIFENTHEAIVSQEVFDTVQKLRATVRRIDHLGAANPLTGLLYCADCGAKLYNTRKAHPEKPTHKKLRDVYNCSTYKATRPTQFAKCTAHHISTEQARGIILAAIRATSGYVRSHEQEFIERVREASAIKQGETAKSYQKQIARNERRIAEIDRVYKALYEDKALGKIDGVMFDEMSVGYLEEKAELRANTDALQSELAEWSADSVRADKFIEIVRRYTSFEELTPAMLNEYIDKVVVHESVWSDGNTGVGGRPRGMRTQQVDVYLKYIGKFDAPELRSAEEIEAERIEEEKLEKKRAYHRKKTQEHKNRKVAAAAAAKAARGTAASNPAA